MTTSLPAWLTRRKDGAFVVDPDKAYPAVLKALGMKPDQYSLEVAYQCVKMKVQEIATAAGWDPEKSALVILIEGGAANKDKWALANHPAGKGAAAATKGREAKGHFERIRHLI